MKSVKSWGEIVRRHFVDIVQGIEIDPVLDYLYAKEVASREQYLRVQSQATEQEKARVVLTEIVPKRGERAYKTFVEALRKSNQFHLLQDEDCTLQLRNT